VLCGERWDSRPQSVHPALAEASSAVNDLLSDDRRRLLTPLAPWLAGTHSAGPQAWAAVARACTEGAPPAVSDQGRPRQLTDPDNAPRPQAAAGRVRRWRLADRRKDRRERRLARHAIGSALLAVAGVPQDDGDMALCEVLVDCINACRRLAGEPPVDPLLPLTACPQWLDVEPQLIRSPGCDWRDLGFRPARELPPALTSAGRGRPAAPQAFPAREPGRGKQAGQVSERAKGSPVRLLPGRSGDREKI
jgi:hypothetical protein